jgi:hypothetical protein
MDSMGTGEHAAGGPEFKTSVLVHEIFPSATKTGRGKISRVLPP